jgi:hypothetical protein
MQNDAAELLEKYPEADGSYYLSNWSLLERLPPEIPSGTTNFSPGNCYNFLEDLSQGNKVSEVSNLGMYGVSEKTHLNILGRLKAATKFSNMAAAEQCDVLKLHRGNLKELDKYLDKMRGFTGHLRAFEKDFSKFVDTHHEAIAAGLEERAANPRGITAVLPPEELWQKDGQSDKAICKAAFDSYKTPHELKYIKSAEEAEKNVAPAPAAEPERGVLGSIKNRLRSIIKLEH